MSALTLDDKNTLILADCNDNGKVAAILPILWRKYDAWSGYDSLDGLYDLQYLHVRIHSLFVLMGDVRWQVTTASKDRQEALDKLFDHVKSMYDSAVTELAEAKKWYFEGSSGGQQPVSDRFDVTLPDLDSPPGWPDAEDSVYSGDPNKRLWPWSAR